MSTGPADKQFKNATDLNNRSREIEVESLEPMILMSANPILGDATDDILDGTADDDYLRGRDGNDQLGGLAGNDHLRGDAGADLLMGDSGNDLLRGGEDNDTLDGGTGDDDLRGDAGIDTALYEGNTSTDAIVTDRGDGRFYIEINGERDRLRDIELIQFDDGVFTTSDLADRAIVGTEGSDTLIGTGSGDELRGLGGSDHINAGAGNDLLLGGEGDDLLRGRDGDDVLDGGSGDDDLRGDAGTDTVRYEGNLSTDAVVTRREDGRYYVEINGERDRLRDVELLEFDDGVFSIEDLAPEEPPEAIIDVIESTIDADEIDGPFAMAVDARFINLADGSGQDVFEFSTDDGSSIIRLGRVGDTNDIEFVIVQDGTEHRVVGVDAIIEGELATWRVGVDPDGVMRIGKDTALLAEGEGVVPDDVTRLNRLIGESQHDDSDIGMSGTVANLRIANYGDLEDLDPERIGTPCAVTGEAQCFCSAIAPNALVQLGLTGETEFSDVDLEGDGEWSQIQSLGVIPVHSLVLPDGKVLSFGTDERGIQGAQYVYSLYDPETGVDIILPQTTDTDIFCSTMSLDPTTGNVIIMGGDARGEGGPTNGAVNDVVVFDYQTQTIRDATQGEMQYDRWYGSSVTLANGEIMVLGGRGGGDDIPEIFNPDTGWRTLTGTNINVGSTYPKTYVASDGSVVAFSGQGTIYRIWTDGSGQSEAIGSVGSVPHRADSPGIMYDVDKIAIVGQDGDLYTADISEDTVSLTKVADLQGARREGGMSLLPDGRVLIAGGTTGGRTIAEANNNIEIWDPATNSIELLDGQQLARLYHSSYQLLPNGTVWVGGGGAPGPLTNTNVEFYAPDYLYGPDGELADRPEITSAPTNVDNNETFRFNVDDTSNIGQITVIRPGSSTHATNFDARFVNLDFTVIDETTIEITTLGSGAMVPGSYMLFAIDNDGIPSEASMLGVSMADIVETENLTRADTDLAVYAIDDDPIRGAFDVDVEARFDDLSGSWQRVFDFGNGPGDNNVLLAQRGTSNDMQFTVYTSNGVFDLIAPNAIVEGETAKWSVSIDETGYTRMWKDDVLVAEGQGIIPEDIARSNRLVGESNWAQDDQLTGMVRNLEIVNAGDEPEYVHLS